jgi:hypothetical protein
MVEDAHRDAYWVVTVVGGLSITKALEESIPVISIARLTSDGAVVLLRLFVFLILVVRFFIGASIFFNNVHLAAGHDKAFQHRNYVMDFASAIIHFSLFYWMASGITSITYSPTSTVGEHFFIALSFILLYDWAWFLVSSGLGYSTAVPIGIWARYNTANLVPCLVAFIAFLLGYINRLTFETAIGILVLLFSLPDIVRARLGDLPR